MAEASISVGHEEFCCAICLEIMKDPVTINCGHCFCMVCINDCWDQEGFRGIYRCPQCREKFSPRPVLRRNNMLAEVVEKLKRTELQAASPVHCYAGPGDVECDFCTGRKRKAIKSCLVCVASLCETHLKPHLELPALKRHKLVKASRQLQEKICSRHDKPIEIYCRTDKSCICYLCMTDEHKGHDTVSAEAETTQKQTQLKEVQRKHQQRIQEREEQVQELKQAVDTLKRSAQAAVEDSEKIFTELISSILKKRDEVTKVIRAQEKEELSRAEGLLEQLEQEIVDLKKRDTELEQLSHTEDHIHFLQSFLSLCASSGSKDSPNITINQHISFDGVTQSLSDMRDRVEELCKEEFNIPPRATAVHVILPPNPKTRDDFLKYFCQFTLDPNTAHPSLSLSKKNKVVTCDWESGPCSEHPARFDWYQVLCKEIVCGRCYWEVEWSSEGRPVCISLAYKAISRKGMDNVSRFGNNAQSWSLQCFPSLSFWHNDVETKILRPPPSRIGVYVDHSAGTLSFHRVSRNMTLLHRVHTKFTQPLYAGFSIDVSSTVKLSGKEC